MTNAEAWFNNSLRPRKPEGSLGRTAQDGHLDCHTAPELCPQLSRVTQEDDRWAVYRVTVLYFDSTIPQFIPSTCSGQSVTSECTTYNSWQSWYFECSPWSISTVFRGSLFTPETWQYMHTHKNTQTLFLISCPSVFIVCSKQLAFLKGAQTTDR